MAKRKADQQKPVPNPGAGGTYLFDVETGELKLVENTLPTGALTDGQALPQEDDPRED